MASLYLLYKKSDPNNIRYVGITKFDTVSKRMSSHRDRMNSGSTLPLYNWMRKHKDVEFFVVASKITLEEAYAREKGIIIVFRELNYKLLNCTKGGESIYDLSKESREKIRKSSTGRVHSAETKIKMSEAKKGKTTWNKGVQMSEESKLKLSKSKTGKKLTEEHKNKISEKLKGRVQSESAKKSIGDAHRGKNVSEETRKKLSEAAKGKPAWNKGMRKSDYPSNKK